MNKVEPKEYWDKRFQDFENIVQVTLINYYINMMIILDGIVFPKRSKYLKEMYLI